MPPRSKPGELPKPVIQRGQFGCLPLNPLTVSYLANGHASLIVGFRDTGETESFRRNPSLQLQEGKKRRTLSLESRFFNGFSDALYRGCLPEVILAAPSAEKLMDFLKDFVEYLGKVLVMGFFITKKHVVQRDPVEELIPCTILSGNGLLFSRFITGLVQELNVLGREHAALDEATRLKILGRFVRGLPSADDAAVSLESGTEALAGRVVSPLPVATRIRLAGGNRQTQLAIQSVLSAHGLITVIENQVRNPVERLEFENALWRLSTVIFPALLGHKLLSAAQARTLAPKAEQGILAIGRKRHAFDDAEPLRALGGGKPAKQPKKEAGQVESAENKAVNKDLKARLTREDVVLLAGLGHYAETLGLADEKRLFQDLAIQVEGCFAD